MYANAAALRFSGMPREAVLGVRLWDLMPALRGTPQERVVRDAMELGRPSTVEYHTPAGKLARGARLPDRRRREHLLP